MKFTQLSSSIISLFSNTTRAFMVTQQQQDYNCQGFVGGGGDVVLLANVYGQAQDVLLCPTCMMPICH